MGIRGGGGGGGVGGGVSSLIIYSDSGAERVISSKPLLRC